MGRSNIENNNKNDFYSYLQNNDLTYINYINQTPKGASKIQRITQLSRSIKKLENKKRYFLVFIKKLCRATHETWFLFWFKRYSKFTLGVFYD